jgi:predicted RNase H-like HicB family nuclease
MALYTYPITIEGEGNKSYAYIEDVPGVFGLGNTVEAAKKGILGAIYIL